MSADKRAEAWLEATLGDWLFVGSGAGPWYAAHKRRPGVRLGPYDTIQDALRAAFLVSGDAQGAGEGKDG